MSFFDKAENTVGQLTTQLASDADAIQNATGTRIANVIKNSMTLATGLFMGFYFSWPIALVVRVKIFLIL
jgi:ABC-type multidrug transport system fused ATPase/permease subunit